MFNSESALKFHISNSNSKTLITPSVMLSGGRSKQEVILLLTKTQKTESPHINFKVKDRHHKRSAFGRQSKTGSNAVDEDNGLELNSKCLNPN